MRKIFDCHSHWGTEKGYIFRTEAERKQQEKVWKRPAEMFSEAGMMDYFRKNNARTILDLAFIRSFPMEEIEGFHNYAFGVQRANPDVIFGHWLQFDGKRIAEAAREYRRCLDAKGGFVGLAMSGQSSGVAASDPAWDPLYRLAIEAGMPVMIFVGLTGIGQGLPGGKGILLDDGHPRHVDAVAVRFPDLQILAARPAWPWQDDMLAVLLHKGNVSYELHGWSPKYFTPALKKEIGGRLQDRIMFGCDFPVLRFETVISDWVKEGYKEEVLDKVLFDNAAGFFGQIR